MYTENLMNVTVAYCVLLTTTVITLLLYTYLQFGEL